MWVTFALLCLQLATQMYIVLLYSLFGHSLTLNSTMYQMGWKEW